jgi:hypothetical protein
MDGECSAEPDVVCHRLYQESVGCIVSREVAKVLHVFKTSGPKHAWLDFCSEKAEDYKIDWSHGNLCMCLAVLLQPFLRVSLRHNSGLK